MARNTGTGQGGKTLNDRKLAASVRTQALTDVLAVLQGKPEVEGWSDYKKQLLAKMSSSLLPRLNEHTGEDGEPLRISFDNAFTPTTEKGR
jgi:hypothetical protein